MSWPSRRTRGHGGELAMQPSSAVLNTSTACDAFLLLQARVALTC